MMGRDRRAGNTAATDPTGPSSPTDPFDELVTAFETAAEPSRADAMAAYMRNNFAFIGLPAPVRRTLAKSFMAKFAGGPEDELLAVAERLWGFPQREYAYVATDLLRAGWRALTPAALPRLRALVLTDSWWDTVDPLSHVIGVLVLNHRELTQQMDLWLLEEDRWLVRVALLHQLGWKSAAVPEQVFRSCLARGADEDFFIRKAIGWALRDLARSHPEQVREFVARHGDELAPMSVSEATKHL